MNRIILRVLTGIVLFVLLQAYQSEPVKQPIDYVDPFIGTDFFGDVFPGPTVPYSMIHVSPDTYNKGWLYRKGYVYTDSSMVGFTHTHGGGGGGEILLMPTTRQHIQTLPGDISKPGSGYRSRFSHLNEKASPGYYQVRLTDNNVNVELTSTARAAMHRYTFPKSEFSRIIIDLDYSINGHGLPANAHLRFVNDSTIEGVRRSVNTTGNIYFIARFSKPFQYYGTYDNAYKSPESGAGIYPMKSGEQGDHIGAFVQYDTKAGEQVLVKVAVSYVSLDGARKNLAAEMPDWSFDQIHRQARQQWAQVLEKMQVEGKSDADKVKFYTSVYRTILSQYIFQDVDGKYYGMDNGIHEANDFNLYCSLLSWDTFRSMHPLLPLLAPDQVDDVLKSVEAKIRECGWVPGLHGYNRLSAGMIGDHIVPIVVDAYLKGFRGFDAEFVYQAMKKKATSDPQPPVPMNVGREGLNEYMNLGYIACDKDRESVSTTLEFAYDDWCLAQFAKALGKTDDFAYFMKRAHNYVNLWDEQTRFMRPRLANGQFLPLAKDTSDCLKTTKNGEHSYYSYFDPLVIGRAPNRHFTESNAWPYLWAVQQDVAGLMKLMGGKDAFTARLDTFFTTSPCEHGYKYVGTVGTIGQYVHGNQPSHHISYFYSYAGQPWKTQYYTRYICDHLYKTGAGGLCGNEDMGSLSSWYIFSSTGFYPVTPGSNYYVLTAPVFDKVTIQLPQKKTFTVLAKNNQKKNVYIQSVKLNGKAISRTWISHQEIMDGGTLEFEMGQTPNKTWGCQPNDVPPGTIQ